MIQPWWSKWISVKWGFAYHTCVLWATRGKIGPAETRERWRCQVDQSVDIVVVYRELISSDLSEPELARRIIELTPKEERKRILRIFATPPEIFGLEGSENSIADQISPLFRIAKLPEVEPADEDAVGGWRMVHNSLRRSRLLASGGRLTREQIEEGPCLFVAQDCINLREAMPGFTRDEKDSELVALPKRPAESYDDTPDACIEALRILCKSMLAAKVDAPADVRRREVWDRHEDPTDRGMAMLKFDVAERRKRVIRRIKPWR